MQLGELLAQRAAYAPVLSFAGRTGNPRLPTIAYRIGGFGGALGLAAYLREQGLRAVIDATHPFAARISANTTLACRETGLPLAVLTRPAWQRADGDRWIEVDSFAAAAGALGETPRNVFLAVGRQELAAFRDGAHRYLIRSVDAVAADVVPRDAVTILARGPFDEAAETELMRQHAIDIVVAKNSGGAATYAKIAAARALGLPVVMIRRPAEAQGAVFTSSGDVLVWLEALARKAHVATS